MPKQEADPDDPMELCAVAIPDPGGAALRSMAECFAEEYLRLGMDPQDVVDLFRHPRYGLAHRAWIELGADEVKDVVERQARVWRRCDPRADGK